MRFTQSRVFFENYHDGTVYSCVEEFRAWLLNVSDSQCNTVQVRVVYHTHTLSYQKEHLTFLEKFLSGDLMQFPIVKSLLLIVRA